MSPKRQIVFTALLAAVASCLFPPWNLVMKGGGRVVSEPAGYSLIAAPPERRGAFSPEIDLTVLAVQLLAISVGAVAAVVYVGRKSREEERD